KGAEVSMVSAPHPHRKAPSRARRPNMRTEAARAVSSPEKVVFAMRYTEVNPPAAAHNWMSRCGSVQKVSRPMDVCHEMSHTPPAIAEMVAITEVHTVQGTRSTRAGWRVAASTVAVVVTRGSPH